MVNEVLTATSNRMQMVCLTEDLWFDGLQGLVTHPPYFVASGQAEGIPQREGAFNYWQEN